MAHDRRTSTDAEQAPNGGSPPAPDRHAEEELRLLGEALDERSGAVLQRTIARTHSEWGEEPEGSLVRTSFERICTLSTHAVAQWMSGVDPSATGPMGKESASIFGQLVAHRAIGLNEVTKRCLRWRDAASEEVSESAERLGTKPRFSPARSTSCRRTSTSRSCACATSSRRSASAPTRSSPPPGRARLHGHARPAHRAAQQNADPRPRRADADALAPPPGPGRGAARQPRQLQDDQRHLGHGAGDELLRRSQRAWTASCATPTRSVASAATSSS